MRISRIASAALVVALSTALTGCGSDSDGKAEKAKEPLTKDLIASALLSVEDVGKDFKVKEEDDDDTDLGCLSDMDSIKDGFPGSKESVDVSIEATPDPNVPEVGNQINTFEDEAAATKALDDFAASLADCETVDETSDGVRFQLQVENDDSTSTSDVDDQFNLDMKGMVTGDGLEIPISQRAKFMRIGNVITAVYFASFETSTSSDTEDLAELVVAKILPLIDGGEVGKPDSLDLTPYTG